MLHKGVTVFVEDGQWYLNMSSPCMHLLPDNRCAIYDKRPRICRNYKTDNCDYHDGAYEYDHHFTTVEALEEFARESLRKKYRNNGQKKRKRSRSTRKTAG
jgi:Fe-S-cluster containining protein